MIDKLNTQNLNDCEIIVESFVDSYSCWAELFAYKVQGQHFIIWLHEVFNHDKDINGFFYFKWLRNEFIASPYSTKKFFNGYKNVTAPLVKMSWACREMDAVQDVDFPIEKVARLDWNICHIGRAVKDYVPYVIQGVGELARRHPSKKINFIMVGKADSRMELLKQTFQNLPNIVLTFLGDLVPIPRILFSKIDVVCGISQSARFAANEGVLTIVGKADNPERTPGVLGYDTNEQIFGEPTFSYVEALENVLIKNFTKEKNTACLNFDLQKKPTKIFGRSQKMPRPTKNITLNVFRNPESESGQQFFLLV